MQTAHEFLASKVWLTNMLVSLKSKSHLEASYFWLKVALLAQNLVARDVTQFKSQLYQMWFRLYTRDVRDDTCG